MNSAFVKCELITPLFSCGANQFNPEIRTTELKGLMRYMYRIACPTQNYTILRQNEAALFGGAADANSDGGHASPIRLSITNTSFKQEKCSLLYHKTTLLQGLVEGSFEIKLTHNDVIADTLNVNLDWYTKLLTLSYFSAA